MSISNPLSLPISRTLTRQIGQVSDELIGGETEPPSTTAVVSINGPSSITEGTTSTNYSVSVNKLAATVIDPITVALTYSGTATNGVDFNGVTSVVILAGTRSVTFTIEALDDVAAESESFTVAIGTITDTNYDEIEAHDSDNNVTTSITDDTDSTTVAISGPTTVSEGATSSNYTVTVAASAGLVTSPITVALTYSGPAVKDTDFTGPSSVIIAAGTNSNTFTIDALTDALTEGDESFTVAIGTITDTNFENLVAHGSSNDVTTTITDVVPAVTQNMTLMDSSQSHYDEFDTSIEFATDFRIDITAAIEDTSPITIFGMVGATLSRIQKVTDGGNPTIRMRLVGTNVDFAANLITFDGTIRLYSFRRVGNVFSYYENDVLIDSTTNATAGGKSYWMNCIAQGNSSHYVDMWWLKVEAWDDATKVVDVTKDQDGSSNTIPNDADGTNNLTRVNQDIDDVYLMEFDDSGSPDTWTDVSTGLITIDVSGT